MRIFRILNTWGIVSLATGLGLGAAAGEPFPPMEGRINLAEGRPVAFSPQPNYGLTAKGDTDETDLTDGETTKRADQRLWFEASSVGWSYPGRVNLSVDLGQICDIDEVAIRLQNNAGGARRFPGWVEAFASNDGEHYAKIAEFSRWRGGDFDKFDIGQNQDARPVDVLRFQGLKAQGRYVGLRLYGGGLMVSDELYIFGEPAQSTKAPEAKPEPTGFTTSRPQVHFHKPYLELATNVALPVPLGITTPADAPEDAKTRLRLDLPPGLELLGEKVGAIERGEDGATRHVFNDLSAAAGKDPGKGKAHLRLYFQATGWKDGQEGELRYDFGDESWSSGALSIPVKAVKVPEAPRLKQIMATMGWWDATSVGWPDELKAMRTLGLNTFSVFSNWLPKDRSHPRWAMIEEARREGFFISNIDSPLHKMMSRRKRESEIYDQFDDGATGNRLCVSYRGQYYDEEIQRYADEMAAVKPDFSSVDIELWTWTGPTDSKKCVRCRADYEKSGLESWDDWQKAKGLEIINDLMTAAREAVEQAGGEPFRSGAYDFRPGSAYQFVFDFNALYPELLQNGEVSTYTSLQPADIAHIGDEARKDRQQLPRSDLTPWNTPGDAGTFPGEAFMWSLLENYCNGARGVWFWSSRVWDSESLIAFNKVIRAIAPAEDVIINGDLIGDDAIVIGPGRISGLKSGDRAILLAADYLGETDGSIKLNINAPADSKLRDLFTGEDLDISISTGEQTLTIPLQGHRARLLELRPK